MKSLTLIPLQRVTVGVLLMVAGALFSHPGRAAEQTQRLTLAAGWNSIWLEVEPTIASGDDAGLSKLVEDVFSNPAVEVVARPEVPVGSAEFISDSRAGQFNQGGWSVWRRDSKSTVDTLVRVHGNRGYLVKCEVGVVIDIIGEVRFFRPTWVPASYNLVGFGLSAPVSFAEFFGPSGGVHPANKIFALSGNRWAGVVPTDLMYPGVAYWVFAEKSSSYGGPVAVRIDGESGLEFGDGPGSIEPQGLGFPVSPREITFTNTDEGSGHPIRLQKVLPATAGAEALGDALRLYEVVPDPSNLSYGIGGSGQLTTWDLSPELGSGVTRTITVGANHHWTSGAAERTNLYQIQVGIGSDGAYQSFWLPATSGNPDLAVAVAGAPESRSAGLWIGEVVVDEVTSLTEAGHPIELTTSKLPLQLIIHAGVDGSPSLLGHALLMKEKVADGGAEAGDVIVVDETKIPYFEGIELRGGKLVGRRLETISYDMPRDLDPTLQPTVFLSEIAASEGLVDEFGAADPSRVGSEQIAAYLGQSASRPPALVEAYHFVWPLEGALSPGSTLGTGSAPLEMDAFHRSNPFRHAFHAQHGAGRTIERTITLTFDDLYEPGLLHGSYVEEISGLTAVPLTVRGVVTLERVSEAVQLQ